MSADDLSISVCVEDSRWHTDVPEASALIDRAVGLTYVMGGRWDLQPVTAELSVMLCCDEDIRVLNRQYRHKNQPTNVLSFALLDDPEEIVRVRQTGHLTLGDLVLARETLLREAVTHHKTPDAHFLHLLVHGTLHLLGYDHRVDAEAEEMEELEIQILARLGVANPYFNESGGATSVRETLRSDMR